MTNPDICSHGVNPKACPICYRDNQRLEHQKKVDEAAMKSKAPAKVPPPGGSIFYQNDKQVAAPAAPQFRNPPPPVAAKTAAAPPPGGYPQPISTNSGPPHVQVDKDNKVSTDLGQRIPEIASRQRVRRGDT